MTEEERIGILDELLLELTRDFIQNIYTFLYPIEDAAERLHLSGKQVLQLLENRVDREERGLAEQRLADGKNLYDPDN